MNQRKGFVQTLMHTPVQPRSRVSQFISLQGLIYMGVGIGYMALPDALLTALTGIDAGAHGLLRLCGFTVAIIGWFYLMGGRTGAASFALATVVDRLVVPLVCAAFVMTGQVPFQTVAPLAVIDPALAGMTWWMWRSEPSLNPTS